MERLKIADDGYVVATVPIPLRWGLRWLPPELCDDVERIVFCHLVNIVNVEMKTVALLRMKLCKAAEAAELYIAKCVSASNVEKCRECVQYLLHRGIDFVACKCLKNGGDSSKPNLMTKEKSMIDMCTEETIPCAVPRLDMQDTFPGIICLPLGGRDLLEVIMDDTVHITEAAIIAIVKNIARFLHGIHSLSTPFVHQDVKLENVVLDRSVCLRPVTEIESGKVTSTLDVNGANDVPIHVIDYEYMSESTSIGAQNVSGTKRYVAPEVCALLRGNDDKEGIDFTKMDSWALGCCVFILLFRRFPFSSPIISCGGGRVMEDFPTHGDQETATAICNREIHTKGHIAQKGLWVNLIDGLLHMDFTKRMTAKQVIDALCDEEKTREARTIDSFH